MPSASASSPARGGALAWFVVLATGALLALFISRTFIDPLPRQYRLDFGAARWIENAAPSASGYFRRTLYLPAAPNLAWLQVAATDRFELSVNGLPVDDASFAAARITGIYDLKPLLTTGKNVIAIYVPRTHYPGNSQVLARGQFQAGDGPTVDFISDRRWKVSTTPDGVIGSYKWSDPLLDDSVWKEARAASSGERFSTVQAVAIDPQIFSRPPSASWLGPRLAGASSATFEGCLDLPTARGSTWLQIAATGGYDVIINGRVATTRDGLQRTTLPFAQPTLSGGPVSVALPDLANLAQSAREAAAASEPLNLGAAASVPTLLAYDVSRWVRAGANSIHIHVRSHALPPQLVADGFTTRPGGSAVPLGSDATWKVREHAPGVGSSGPAVVLGSSGMRPWGALPQAPGETIESQTSGLRQLAHQALVLLVVVAAVVALWLALARWRSTAESASLVAARGAAAAVHVPTAAVLLLLWLLSFDVRFASDWCFTPPIVLGAVGLLLASYLFMLLHGHSAIATSQPRSFPATLKLIAFLAVVLLGFWLRARELNTVSLGSDEVTMIGNADGVVADGYPHSPRGSYDRLLATYELVPYPLALSSLIFGRTEFAYHLPALIFGTLTIALIGFVGTRMCDWRIGLLSALIYACFPPALAWSRNAFYPAQEQFISLAMFWFFFEAIRGPAIRGRYATWTAVTFLLGYFSWEGSGFALPALFIALLLVRWRDFDWIKDWHLWRCFVVVTLVVVAQLSYRQLAMNPYLAVGYSLSDVTSPQLVYRDLLVYNPAYYLKVLFFSEVNFAISLCLFGGFLFCWRDSAIRYLVVAVFVLELCYTNLLPFYAPRYCYNAEVLLILAGVAIFFRLCDGIIALGGNELPHPALRAWRWAGAAMLTLVFGLATNEFAVKSFRLSLNPANPALFGRLGYYKTDHRGAVRFVSERFAPGDGVIAFMPHVFEFYSTLRADYSINTVLNAKMTYDVGMERPQFIDKFWGRPLIRSTEEFREVLSRHRRLWILLPLGDEEEYISPDLWRYFEKRGRVAFESYRQQVILIEAAQSAAPERAAD